ncbi:MAG: winged helix-turn-helix transcriptional regulator [Candidatus Thorarchaeota archaeon]
MVDPQINENCPINGVKDPCFIPAQKILNLISKKWGIQLIHILHNGEEKRYNEIKEELRKGWKEKQISDATLSSLLSEFVKMDLIIREVYPEIPPKVVYSLSKKGLSLSQSIQPLIKWTHDYCHKIL